MRSGRLLLLSAVCALLAAPAGAHTENGDGYSTIRVEASRVSYDLFLDYFEFARVVRLGAARGAPPSALREALGRRREELEAHLGTRLVVSLDGVGCEPRVTGTDVERRLDRDYAHVRLEFSCPGAHPGGVRVRYGLLFDDSDPSHRNLVTYEAEGRHAQFVFTSSQRELRLGEGSATGQALRFVELGIHHILSGYDHVLFVVALLLGTTSLLGVLRVLSVFTLAHSITLAGALLGVARFPPGVVEPLIALSIAYVAVESFSPAASRWRLPVVFGFGLVHGMGFAGALQITGAKGWGLAAPLLSFNLGIELGQGLLVLLVFPLLMLVRRLSWSRLAHGLAQGAIAAFGLLWYFQRLTS
jgi:hydrogenase/urease accessory protein HupE